MGCYIKMINEKPIISLVSAAIRDYRYKPYYDSVSVNNEVSFEVIFVGPNPPKEKMPDNFRYIETSVKPGQCYEIGAREAKGEYIHTPGDDFTFSLDYLNNAYKYISMLDKDKVLVSCRCRHVNGKSDINRVHTDHGFVLDAIAENAPFNAIAPFFRRDLWYKLGGLDRRFYGSFNDVDLQHRFYEVGFRPFLAPECIVEENTFYQVEKRSESLLVRCCEDAGKLLRSLWFNKDGSFSKTRLSPVQSFISKDILTKDQ